MSNNAYSVDPLFEELSEQNAILVSELKEMIAKLSGSKSSSQTKTAATYEERRNREISLMESELKQANREISRLKASYDIDKADQCRQLTDSISQKKSEIFSLNKEIELLMPMMKESRSGLNTRSSMSSNQSIQEIKLQKTDLKKTLDEINGEMRNKHCSCVDLENSLKKYQSSNAVRQIESSIENEMNRISRIEEEIRVLTLLTEREKLKAELEFLNGGDENTNGKEINVKIRQASKNVKGGLVIVSN
jgi:hypothetical protein